MTDHASWLRRAKQAYRRRRLARYGVVARQLCTKSLVGSGSGAWTVCLDGIDESSVVYSFGAGTDISFDLELHRLTGAEIHIFDPTPRSIDWMRRQELPEGVRFHEFGIGAADGEIEFHPPRRASSSHFSPVARYRRTASGEVIKAPVLRLATIAHRLGHERIALMKMDIEGGEYAVIEDMAAADVPVNQLLVEFHHSYATIPLSRTVAAVRQLERVGFACFHLSERTYEMSFIAADPAPFSARATPAA